MGWVIAFVAIAVLIAAAVTGVAYPLLYGAFIAAVVLVPLLLVSGAIDALFGRRK